MRTFIKKNQEKPTGILFIDYICTHKDNLSIYSKQSINQISTR